MDITSAAAGHRAQEVTGNDYICRGAADPPRSGRCDPARAVGTQTATDSFQSETALGALSFHTMVGRLHGEPRNKALQRLIRAFACLTTVTLIHFMYSSLQKQQKHRLFMFLP